MFAESLPGLHFHEKKGVWFLPFLIISLRWLSSHMTNPFFPIKPTMVISVCLSFISPQRKFSFPICLLLMANGNKLFCWNAILLIFALVNAEDHWKGEKHEHLPFDLCILEACRLRISALGAHIPTCQALDLPTEFNPWDAPTLVSGLPRAISGLLQFAVLLPQAWREGCTHSPERPLPAAPEIPVWQPAGSEPHSDETLSMQFST